MSFKRLWGLLVVDSDSPKTGTEVPQEALEEAQAAVAAEWEQMQREAREASPFGMATVMPDDWTERLARVALEKAKADADSVRAVRNDYFSQLGAAESRVDELQARLSVLPDAFKAEFDDRFPDPTSWRAAVLRWLEEWAGK